VRSVGKTLLLLSLLASPARAVVLDPNFVETDFVAPSDSYTSLAWAPDGSNRLFLTHRDGEVRIVENGALLSEPFLTVSEIYSLGGECGLLGIAFDPNFGENGFVYLFVSVSTSEQKIVRYRANGNVGVEPTTIVAGIPTRGANHDGGAIGFGPDAKLYWATGDLGNGTGINDDLLSLGSKVGRVNRDGTVPEDNPFADGPGPNDDRIWARGFRNPFTMTFQPDTGRLWLNVVGSNYEQVFAVGAGDHGGYTVAFERSQPAGFLRPLISYVTDGTEAFVLAPNGVSRTGGVATFTTTAPHWLLPGEPVVIAGVVDPSFDGAGFVRGAPSETTFTMEQPSLPNTTSGGGTATTTELGGCIVGGTFYDSSAATSAYRGNFFFGDFNSGNILRARVSGPNVSSVEIWATGHDDIVDMDVGPDGDIYHVAYRGWRGVGRERFQPSVQGIVVSKANVWMVEDGVSAFNVRLSLDPGENVEVSVSRTAGSADVTVTEGATLVFGTNDWMTPKIVRLSATRDADATDDASELTATAEGLDEVRVGVRVTDEYEGPEPPGEGGAGGESGAGGDGMAGDGAASGQGGRANGGVAGTSGGRSGGTGGMGEGGEAGGAPNGASGSGGDAGCGCGLRRSPGPSAMAVFLLLVFARRRASRNASRRR
jgi:glucose/arabinose dehydrogenase